METCKHGYPLDFFCLSCAYEYRGIEIDRLRKELDDKEKESIFYANEMARAKQDLATERKRADDWEKIADNLLGRAELNEKAREI